MKIISKDPLKAKGKNEVIKRAKNGKVVKAPKLKKEVTNNEDR